MIKFDIHWVKPMSATCSFYEKRNLHIFLENKLEKG